MATAIFGSPIKKVFGEQASLTTTASHLLFKPNYHEAKMYCASAWRMGLAPKITSVKYAAVAGTFTDYTAQATDRVATTHVPLDAMPDTDYLYLGTTEPVRGFYFNVDAVNLNDEAATLDWEYCYDISDGTYLKLTGTVSGALTVGETVTGQTSGATAVVVQSNAADIIVKSMAGTIVLGEDVDGAAETCDDISSIDKVAKGTAYFTDVASDTDGTDAAGDTLKQDGLYSFTLPSVVSGFVTNLGSGCWYRFTPSATLSAEVDLIDIIPACDTVNYAFMEGGVEYQFSLNVAQNGAFEFDHTGADTLNITWIQH